MTTSECPRIDRLSPQMLRFQGSGTFFPRGKKIEFATEVTDLALPIHIEKDTIVKDQHLLEVGGDD